jgi:hypothetical protein
MTLRPTRRGISSNSRHEIHVRQRTRWAVAARDVTAIERRFVTICGTHATSREQKWDSAPPDSPSNGQPSFPVIGTHGVTHLRQTPGVVGHRPLSETLIGTWELVDGSIRTPSEESSPRAVSIGLVVYDGHGNFTAQFMARDRRPEVVSSEGAGAAAPNNSRSVGGYDAYFGRYVVDDAAGRVTQTLVGSLAPEDVGQVLSRDMAVEGDELTIRVETATDDGDPALMTLRWKRIG